MFTYDILIDFSKTGYQPEIAEQLEDFLSCLYDARQIINETDYSFVYNLNTLSVSVICPEKDSLNLRNNSVDCKYWLVQIEKTIQTRIQFIATGNDLRYEPILNAINSKYSEPKPLDRFIEVYALSSLLLDMLIFPKELSKKIKT